MASSGGTPPIDTTSSPTMIARKITGRLRQRRTIKRGRRSGWIGLEFSTMGQIAVRYPHSDSVLMLCTLCGKNMPALAECLYFTELSIPGLSGWDVHFGQGQRVVAGLGLRVAVSWVAADDSATSRVVQFPSLDSSGLLDYQCGEARTWDRQRFISSSLGF